MPFDVSETTKRFYGYGPLPIPTPLDEEVEEFVDGLRTGGPQAVATAIEHASETGRQVLQAYSTRMASRAVRERDATFIVRGLVAIVVGGLDSNDRAALLEMPLLEDSARRIGVLPLVPFEEAAHVVGLPGETFLALWLGRKPEDRTLKVMGYVAGDDADGFRYVRTW